MPTKVPPAMLYRVLNFRYLLDLFHSRTLYLARPTDWQDPWEQLVTHDHYDNIFGQCWSSVEPSDALWRIYSPDQMSLCISVSREALLKAARSTSSSLEFEPTIEEVKYLPSLEAVARIQEIAAGSEVQPPQARAIRCLLVKRNAFQHEHEVRLIGYSRDAGDIRGLRLPINPHRLIKRIEFDPRVDMFFREMCQHYLERVIRYRRAIEVSSLYSYPAQAIAL